MRYNNFNTPLLVSGYLKLWSILIDEGDFFRKGEQEDVRHVSERYIAKSDPYIVMVSTPNAPDGLFERIEKESGDTCLYSISEGILEL
jgi:hypothetical protein